MFFPLSFEIFLLVSAEIPAIDLLQALDLPANHSQYIGVALAQGNENNMAYQLSEYNFKISDLFCLKLTATKRVAKAKTIA